MKNIEKLKISHIALIVTDLDKARGFYTKILNLEEIERPRFYIQGLWYSIGDFELHLMLSEGASLPHVHPLNETVQPHFAMAMTETEFVSMVKRIQSAKVEVIGDVEVNPAGVKQFFFYDPDRNMLEINNELGQNS